jgi:hypothetical protein
MKRALLGALILVVASYSLGAARVITLTVEKGADGKTHWMPERVEVSQGETVTIVAKYPPPKGAFEFHGLFIPKLNIKEEVYFGKKPVEVTRTIPKDMKPGEYKIECHVHDTHVPAILVVKEAAPTK